MESEWLAGRQSQIQMLLTHPLVKQGVFEYLSLRNEHDGFAVDSTASPTSIFTCLESFTSLPYV